MGLFNVDIPELLTFFAVLVRFSVIFSILPFLGDRVIPVPVKILVSLLVSVTLYPSLVASGRVIPSAANVWAASAGGMVSTISLEVLRGLALGYIAKFAFDSISMGANLMGNFMGFASASYFDPHQESQTEVIAQVQNSLAMLVFLAINGHHLILNASLASYQLVGLGKATLGDLLSRKIIAISAEVIRYGVQMSAPVAISIFSTNISLGLLAKAIPQLNVFVLTFAVTALVGFSVMLFSLPEFQQVAIELIGKSKEWMEAGMLAMGNRS